MVTAVGRGFDSRHLHNAGCRRDVSDCSRHSYTPISFSLPPLTRRTSCGCGIIAVCSVVDAHTTGALQDAE